MKIHGGKNEPFMAQPVGSRARTNVRSSPPPVTRTSDASLEGDRRANSWAEANFLWWVTCNTEMHN